MGTRENRPHGVRTRASRVIATVMSAGLIGVVTVGPPPPVAIAAPAAAVIITGIDTLTVESGEPGIIRVQLATEPTDPVSIPVSSTDVTEGTVPATVVLNSSNWFDGVEVAVTPGASGDAIDGDVSYTLMFGDPSSIDAAYDALGAGDTPDITITNLDIDSLASVIVTETDRSTSEAGATATVTYTLNQSPASPVTFTVATGDVTEGTPRTTAVSLDSTNYSTGVAITVDGADDSDLDGNVAYQLTGTSTSSADGNFDGLAVQAAGLFNVDDEVAGVTVTTVDASTDEAGATASVQFSLSTQPTGSVTIPLSLSDATEGSLGVTEIVITPANWNTPAANVVTVTGIDDAATNDVDGDQSYSLVTGDPTSDDRNYEAIPAASVADASLTNTDLDTASDLRVIAGPATGVLAGGPTRVVQFSVVNDGPSTATSVVLDVTLPADVALAATGNPLINFNSCTAVTGGATCAIGSVPNGETVEVALTVVAADPAAAPASATMTAVARSAVADPNASNDTATGNLSIGRAADFSVTAVPIFDVAGRPGMNVIVQNAGPSAGSGTVRVTLPAGASLAPTTDSRCTASGVDVSCVFAAFAPNTQIVLPVVLVGNFAAGSIPVSVAGTFSDPGEGNNTTSVDLSPQVSTTTTTTTTTTVAASTTTTVAPATTVATATTIATTTTMAPASTIAPTTTVAATPSTVAVTTTVAPTTSSPPIMTNLPATGSSGSNRALWFGFALFLAGLALVAGVRRQGSIPA